MPDSETAKDANNKVEKPGNSREALGFCFCVHFFSFI
jgi:hypothetical protein